MKSKRKMPRKKRIAEYWVNKILDKYPEKYSLDAFDEEFYIIKNMDMCFACCAETTTQRCHIKPRHEGGEDDITNIHLLCVPCHLESELLSGDIYWDWFKQKGHINSSIIQSRLLKADMYARLYRDKKFQMIPPIILTWLNVYAPEIY